jgi:hypothetical protein
MKKIITISLALFGVVFLAGCSLQPVSQTPSTTSTAVSQQPVATTTPPTDETASWKTYTNPTFGYSIKYPATWTEKTGKQSVQSKPEDIKNMGIEFYNNNTRVLGIMSYKISEGHSNLLAIISNGTDLNNTNPNIMAYKIGNLDGYRKLATSSLGDINNGFNVFNILTYMTKDSKYIYVLDTDYASKNAESPEIAKMLKTFTTE